MDGVGCDIDRANERLPLGIHHCIHGKIARIELVVIFSLPVVLINSLLKISFPIKQGDTAKVESEVAGTLDMVASQNAQTAGRDRQCFVQAKFCGKICDSPFSEIWSFSGDPSVLTIQIRLKLGQDISYALGIVRLHQSSAEFGVRHFMQNGNWVMVDILPSTR